MAKRVRDEGAEGATSATAAGDRITLKRSRLTEEGESVPTKTAAPEIEFEVPPEWAALAKEPCRDPLPTSMKDAYHSFIHGDRTLRRVRKKYDGTMGPLQAAVTTKRLETARALKDLAHTEAGLAGGGLGPVTVEPRKVGSYFQVNPKALSGVSTSLTGGGATGDELDVEVEPIMAFVRKSVLRSGAKLNFDVVKEALESITPEAVQARVLDLQTSTGKARRKKKVAPPEGWATKAFMKLLQERMHDIMYTTREDIEFRDGIPMRVMKQYDTLRGGDVPVANGTVMTKYREYLMAQREYQLRSAAKSASTKRGREEMDGVRDKIMQFMLKNGLRSQYLEPTMGGEKQPLFIRIKVRPPKFGKKPTVKWVLQTMLRGGEEGTTAEPSPSVMTQFLQGSATDVEAFRASLLAKMRQGFKELEAVEITPAEMYLSVDYAKPKGGEAGVAKFSKVQMH